MKKITLPLEEFGTYTGPFVNHSVSLMQYIQMLTWNYAESNGLVARQPAQEYVISTHGGSSGELSWSKISRIAFNLVRKILPFKICSLSQYPSKDLSLLLGSKDGSKIGQDSQQVMQTIINATQEDQINIVHIFSCQSNLAHGALERLNGDIVNHLEALSK